MGSSVRTVYFDNYRADWRRVPIWPPTPSPTATASITPQNAGNFASTYYYSYDAVGNRLSQTANGNRTSYSYDTANRLTSVNGQAYTWDNNGNLVSDGLLTYSYDQANRLKQVTQGANTYTFAYNGVGDRLSQTVGITTTRYALDPAAGLTQVLADGTNTYLYGNGRLAQYQTAMQYFGADGLGSVRQLYDASGTVIATNRYDPYGSLMSHSGEATSVFGFTGEQWDAATGLEYLRARYYSPYLNQWIQPDPIISDYAKPQSLNRYTYVLDNPTNSTDPSGLDPNWCDYRRDEKDCREKWFNSVKWPSPFSQPSPTPTATGPGNAPYLTFDDGPDPSLTPQIAAALIDQNGAKATFFLTGFDEKPKPWKRIFSTCDAKNVPEDWAGKNVASLIKAQGHAVGVHGWVHNNLWDRTPDPANEVKQVVDALKTVGVTPDPLLRAPGGYWPKDSKGQFQPVKGYENWYYYGWTIPQRMNLMDAIGTPKDQVLKNLESELKAAGCPDHCPKDPIILLHSINPGTVDAVLDKKNGLLSLLGRFGYTQFLSLAPAPARAGDRPGVVLK